MTQLIRALKKGRHNTQKAITLNKGIVKWYRGIGTKFIISFMLPVCFVIIIGVLSYQKAAKSILDNFNKSSLQSISMTGEYIRFGFDSIENTVLQYTMDNNLQKYFLGLYDNDTMQKTTVLTNIRNSLITKQRSDPFIENIHIFSKNKDEVISSSGKTVKDLYRKFLDSDGGSMLMAEPKASYWIGKDEAFDQIIGISSNDYAIRYIKGFSTGDTVVLADISKSTIEDILNKLSTGKGSIIGFVTEDGKEIVKSDRVDLPEQVFTNENFYKISFESNLMEGSESVTYQGEEYIYFYSKVGDSNVMICSLIPKAILIQQVSSIKNLTLILVILSSLVAIAVGLFISLGMQRVIRYIITQLKKVSQGDLAVKLNVTRKDEFLILSEGINDTIENMRSLIEKIHKHSASVTKSSLQVNEAANVFSDASRSITDAIGEIQVGIYQQAQDSENCLIQMDNLSQKIEVVSGKTNEISTIAQDTKQSIEQGIESMSQLNVKSESTSHITANIINKIGILDEKSLSISKITDTINKIADETNLLSLNASIEAARAGVAGSGFSVVAGEIRKLADQSISAVHDIELLIQDMQIHMKETVQTAEEANLIVREQEGALNKTRLSFNDISHQVERLLANVDMILENIQQISVARTETLAAIENITAVSEETAAASSSVNDTTSNQTNAINSLNQLSKELEGNANALSNAVAQFKLTY